MLDQPAYVDRGAKLPLRTPHQKNHAIVSAGLMSALGQKQTCAAHNPMSAVPIADIALSPGSTYSFDVFDGYQAFRGSTLLLFESTVPTSLTQRLCPKASVTERPIALPPELVGAYAMQQSHIHDPFKPIDFPPCPRCGSQMWLTRIEPTDKPDYDQRTLECHRCEHSESMIVKFR
jgi:hypothetical protein